MKKLVYMLAFVLLAIGTISAQGRHWVPSASAETVTKEGTLQLQNGHIVLSTGDTAYFIPGLMRYVSFIDELREGASISAEGFVFGNFLRLTRFTVGGREYDLGINTPRWGGYAHCGFGPMRGGGFRRGHW
jgi:hypothetical protein